MIEDVVADLARKPWSVVPGFLAAAAWQALADRARSASRAGELRPAGVGQGAEFAIRPEVRGDRIGWLDPGASQPETAAYLARMEALRLALNRAAFLGLFEFETHFSVYPPGARYARHSDRLARSTSRVLSTVLYLNAGWEPADGGALRLHLGDGTHADIEPHGGTLVVFASELEHEVLPAGRERLSLAGWFKRRA